ncbi:hypothetical protein PbJCM13498_36030 [Prolixibacter bellariivorans]|uniref:Uncharacterized protein n=1 Tax=Prolixibacter bellariivorans TaxID=314319 RepID=A0A5M4B3M0_9BACT|nr:hypothetical protein [Prolixibacter bellariivorans]GET34740.1 hypothetical protein PbJCM13498_36030 [Prolixibacter bellariivorans]
MKILTLYILSLILSNVLCAESNSEQIFDDTKLVISTPQNQISKDSIDLKKLGEDILNGKAHLNQIDEKSLDLLVQKIIINDSIERAFYIIVFKKIRKKLPELIANSDYEFLPSDIGDYTKLYCLNYPNEFFKMDNSDITSFAYDIGELIRTEEEDPKGYAKEYILEIKEKSDPKYSSKIEIFSNQINRVIIDGK